MKKFLLTSAVALMAVTLVLPLAARAQALRGRRPLPGPLGLPAPQRPATPPSPAPPGCDVNRMCRGIFCPMCPNEKHPASLRDY